MKILEKSEKTTKNVCIKLIQNHVEMCFKRSARVLCFWNIFIDSLPNPQRICGKPFFTFFLKKNKGCIH